MARPKGSPKLGGRKKGTPNKVQAELKDMILKALEEAHDDGAVAYLSNLARTNSSAFASLLGRVLPRDINANVAGAIGLTLVDEFKDKE